MDWISERWKTGGPPARISGLLLQIRNARDGLRGPITQLGTVRRQRGDDAAHWLAALGRFNRYRHLIAGLKRVLAITGRVRHGGGLGLGNSLPPLGVFAFHIQGD